MSHGYICASTLSSSRLPVSLFSLPGPGHLHEITVSAFSRRPLGRANTFSFLSLRSISRVSLKCFSDFTLFLSASLFLLAMLSSYCALYFPADIISSWFPPTSFHTLSRTLSHLTPARPSVSFSHTAISTMAGNPFLGMFLYYFMLPFQLYLLSVCLDVCTFPVLLLTLLEAQSRFGDKPFKLQVVCPQNGTAVLKGLMLLYYLSYLSILLL